MTCLCWRGLLVDVIHRLWDRGIMRDNKWLKLCNDNYLDYWTAYRACLTMQDVDAQVAVIVQEPEVKPPVYWEEVEGETPLGGPLGYTYQFDDAPGSSDSV